MRDAAKPPSGSPRPGLHEALRDGLVRLIGIPSPSHQERPLADHFERSWQAVPGADTRRIGDNLTLRFRACAGRPVLLLAGHLDTVPAQDNLTPVVDGDRVQGLGASDLKAGLAVFQELITDLDPALCPCDPVFVLYVREEVGFAESGLIEVEAAWPDIHDAAFAICVEPTDNRVELGCLGTLHAEVRIRGRSAHSARPWQGDNAIHAALPVLQKVAATEPREVRCGPLDSLEFTEVLSVTTMQGGRARNMIPDHACLNLNFRFGPDRTVEEAREHLRALVGDVGEVVFVDAAPSGRVAGDNPWCRSLIELAGGQTRAKQAWTDVGRFSAWGVDAVSFGPGLTSQAHQKHEYASIQAMVDSYAMFHRLLQSGATG